MFIIISRPLSLFVSVRGNEDTHELPVYYENFGFTLENCSTVTTACVICLNKHVPPNTGRRVSIHVEVLDYVSRRTANLPRYFFFCDRPRVRNGVIDERYFLFFKVPLNEREFHANGTVSIVNTGS